MHSACLSKAYHKMKLRTAAIYATDDDGNRIGGPYFLPLDDVAKQELNRLAREFGPVELKPKEQTQ